MHVVGVRLGMPSWVSLNSRGGCAQGYEKASKAQHSIVHDLILSFCLSVCLLHAMLPICSRLMILPYPVVLMAVACDNWECAIRANVLCRPAAFLLCCEVSENCINESSDGGFNGHAPRGNI